MNAVTIEEWLVAKVAAALGIPRQDVDRTVSFVGMGMDSLTFLTITGELAEWLNVDLPVQLIWEFPTIETRRAYLSASGDDVHLAPIPRIPRGQPMQLSFSQERTWRHANKQGDNNIISEQWMVKGDLDYEILKRAFAK